MAVGLPPRPDVVLFDAGNTLVFFDEDAAVAALHAEGFRLDASKLRAAHGEAKRAYEGAQGGTLTHPQAWELYVGTLLRVSGLAAAPASASTIATSTSSAMIAPAMTAAPMTRGATVTSDTRRGSDGRELVAAAVACLRRAHAEHNLWRRAAPDASSVLARLAAAGLRLGVVSNSEGTVASILREVGLAPHLEVILDSHDEGLEKPDARFFQLGLTRLAARRPLPPDASAVYVGDVPAVDVRGAAAAGLTPIFIDTYGHYPGFDECARIETLSELTTAWLGRP